MHFEELNQQLKKVIEPFLEQDRVELVELRLIRQDGRPTLRILVDKKDGGISVGECAMLNREIGKLLDQEDLIRDKYVLEVSSPGLDRPLAEKSDFARCLNKRVRFFLREPLEEKLEWEGEIRNIDDDFVFVKAKDKELRIPVAAIAKAKQTIEVA
ncbi:ribosome maturation factor RimP [Candidatus Omnitrophota bacterium]